MTPAQPRFDFPTLAYGGDYNPEQWPSDVWDEDVALMQVAGVNVASVAIFAWARLEPSPGVYEFAWLDDVLDRLHAGGIGVLLATATASPPPWFALKYPQSLPVTADGVRLGPGSRQHYSPSSPDYCRHALQLVTQLAERYGSHPALLGWHINNEYGCHVWTSYDSDSAAAFRLWLHQRYGTVEALNVAWGTDFWSQRYGSFDEIEPPAAMPTFANPTQLLDWDRFSSHALLALFLAESQILRRVTPDVPLTTNLMGFARQADYWQWAPHLDLICDDAYPDPSDPQAYVRLCAQRDLMRSLGGGRPWLLMECATAAVQWRTTNLPKPPGLHRAQSLQAIARGSDGILHFQWRQSRAGAEKFHSAMLPHAGAQTRVFREVCALGAELSQVSARFVGQSVPARVAILLDWDSWRAVEQPSTPDRQDYVAHLLEWYQPFLRRGITLDFQPVDADLSSYALVLAPMLHVVSQATLERLGAHVSAGGHLVVGYQSAVLDQNLHVWLGGYLGPLQRTLGVHIEEWAPLSPTQDRTSDSTQLVGQLNGFGRRWQDIVVPQDAEVVASFADGFAAGGAAVTRRREGTGSAWYVGTLPDEAAFDALVGLWALEADLEPLMATPTSGVEAVRRGETLVVVNHTAEPVEVPLITGIQHLEPFGVHLSDS